MVPDDADCPQFLKRKGASPTVNVRKRWVALTIDVLPLRSSPEISSRYHNPTRQRGIDVWPKNPSLTRFEVARLWSSQPET